MPKVYLTEAQRKRARCEAKSRMLGDGLAVYKARGHLTNQSIADELGIGRMGVARLISGEDLRYQRHRERPQAGEGTLCTCSW